MKAAIISFTEKGKKLSELISDKADFLIIERFCFVSHSDSSARSFDNLSLLTAEIFDRFDALIFISACGIAVRAIAPHLKSKITDPAVLTIDDCGKFIIPVLSGHIGGANAIAEKLADIVGSQAVVTTATDTGGHFSPDSFAVANNLIIHDMYAAKAIASAVLDGERTGIVSEYKCSHLPKDVVADKSCRTGMYIGIGDVKPFPITLKLIPRNIVIGIGCKRGSSYENIEKSVIDSLKSVNIPIERVSAVATIDIKKNETGLLDFCHKHKLELFSYTADELKEVNGDFTPSDFVRSVTGVDNVCERSAVKHSGGRLIMRKTSAEGVTVAAAESMIILDFERKLL